MADSDARQAQTVLTAAEAATVADLATRESAIERSLQTCAIEVGMQLREIRDGRLYRVTYRTFEQYLRDRWGWSRQHGYRLIDAAEVAAVVSPMGDIPSERVLRELASVLRDEGEQAVLNVYREARDNHGIQVTADDMRRVVTKRLRRREKLPVAAAAAAPLAGDAYLLLRGDLLEVEIPWPVDVIITDPPYPAEFIDCYAKLGELAARVLPVGGSVVAMAGQHMLPDVHDRLRRRLTYVWELGWFYEGGTDQPYWPYRISNTWKPVLWYANRVPRSRDRWTRDSVHNRAGRDDKAYHRWGQTVAGVRELVERFSEPGDTILDPFVGGGSTAIAALGLGRRFIGIDIDADAIATTAARIRDDETLREVA